MKRTVSIIALALVVMQSCMQEERREQTMKVTFTAESESSTKTVLNNTSVLWQTGDAISVLWADNNSCRAEAKPYDSGLRAEFEAVVGNADSYYAVYPYSAGASLSSRVLTVEIPEVQDGTFAKANHAVAKADSDNNFSFRHVAGYIEFTIDKTGIVEISGVNGDVLTGSVKVTGFDDNLVPQIVTVGKSDKVRIDVKSSGTYYAAVLPDAELSCLSITLEDGTSYEYAFSNNGMQLERGKLYSLGNISDRLTGKKPLSATLESFILTEFVFE